MLLPPGGLGPENRGSCVTKIYPYSKTSTYYLAKTRYHEPYIENIKQQQQQLHIVVYAYSPTHWYSFH